jgi:Domain of unknown function (DUF3850)
VRACRIHQFGVVDVTSLYRGNEHHVPSVIQRTFWGEESKMKNVSTRMPSPPLDGSREPVEHAVKSWPHLFEATLKGVKTHDLRRADDREYRVGDILRLQEFDPETQRYTGRELRVRITYITSAQFPCALSDSSLDPAYCILSITKE